MLPNVFINVASPIVGVPLLHFFWGECASAALDTHHIRFSVILT